MNPIRCSAPLPPVHFMCSWATNIRGRDNCADMGDGIIIGRQRIAVSCHAIGAPRRFTEEKPHREATRSKLRRPSTAPAPLVVLANSLLAMTSFVTNRPNYRVDLGPSTVTITLCASDPILLTF
jgi:hypothetical protein